MFLLSFLFTFTFCYYLFIFYIKSNLSRRGTSSLFISIIILIMIVRKPAGNNGKTKTDINHLRNFIFYDRKSLIVSEFDE